MPPATKDAAGNLVVDKDALLDRSKAAALAQLEIQTGADGTQSIKLKLADKKAALVDLGKHLGMFTEKTEVAVTRQRENIDPRQLAMAILATIRAGVEAERTMGPILDEDQVPVPIASLSYSA